MDDEITGMFQVAKILENLDENARARVLRWAADKYGIDLGQRAAEVADEEDAESTDKTMLRSVDPEKVAAAKQAGEEQAAEDSQLEVKPASSLEHDEAPERDPERPSFLDTSFRMYSGKKKLKKTTDEKK